MIGVRRKARAIALQALYEIDSSRHEAGKVLDRLLAEERLSEDNKCILHVISSFSSYQIYHSYAAYTVLRIAKVLGASQYDPLLY